MSVIDLYADALKPSDVKGRVPRVACRAVVQKGDQVLLLYLPGQDVFNLPGGGLEESETETQCVLRELKEETGYDGIVVSKTLTVREHFAKDSFEARFFLVALKDEPPSKQKLTPEEQSSGIELRWLNPIDALELLETYDSRHPHGANIHNREFLGLIHSMQNTTA